LPKYEPRHNAPKLRAYLERQSGKRVLLMEKRVWNELKKHKTGGFEVDVSILPMANVLYSKKVASIAKRTDSDEFEIKIFREDLEDTKPINVDKYVLHDDFYSRVDFVELVKRASTCDDENIQTFFDNTVLIEIKEHGKDHHINYDKLPELISYRFENLI